MFRVIYILGFLNFYINVGLLAQTSFTDINQMIDSVSTVIPESERTLLLAKIKNEIFKVSSDTLRNSLLIKCSLTTYRLGDYKHFLDFNKKALELASESRDSVTMARSYRNFGSYYLSIGDNVSAYYNTFQASKLYRSLNNYELLGKTLLNMALVQANVKDYIGSEASTVQALKFLNDSKDYYSIFALYDNLANTARELNRYEDAVEYQKKSLIFAKKNENPTLLELKAINNLGLTHERQGNYKLALEQYKKALDYTKNLIDSPIYKAVILDNYAYAKFKTKDYSELPELFFEPLQICKDLGHIPGLISTRIHLADYYHISGAVGEAYFHAKKAEQLAVKNNYIREELEALLLLSKIAKVEEGLRYAQRYIKLNDSIQQQERTTRDQFARIRFETDEIEEQKEIVTRQKNFLASVTFGILLLSVLLYVIVKQRQRNKELVYAQNQQRANEEIYRLMLSQQVKLEEGRQLEKRRVSEELHDGVLGRLFGTRLGLDGLNQRVGDTQAPKRNEYILELANIEHEIRRISHDLSSNTFISEVAFGEIVEELIQKQSEVHGWQYEFSNDPAIIWEEVKDSQKINFYRIIQEALQNIAKHAKAKNISIRFIFNRNSINLTILDDGVGFKKSNQQRGIGLKNIVSRVKDLNGEYSFSNNDNKGAKVSITIAT